MEGAADGRCCDVAVESMTDLDDEQWMREALAEARLAGARGDVPVGAVLVHEGRVLARAHNERELTGSPLAHAEVLALERAGRSQKRWRLDDCTLYVTLEPCPMCAGALVQARLGKLVFGAFDARHGAARSLYQLCDDPRAPHQLRVHGGVLEPDCVALLQGFFQGLRERAKAPVTQP